MKGSEGKEQVVGGGRRKTLNKQDINRVVQLKHCARFQLPDRDHWRISKHSKDPGDLFLMLIISIIMPFLTIQQKAQ